MFENNNIQDSQIAALSRKLFVVHFWQNLSTFGADGSLFNLDTKILDVDGENPVRVTPDGPVTSGGVGFLKRLRLLPVSATQRPLISNVVGFSASNAFLGSMDANAKPAGLGSMMGTTSKTNVRVEWSYPEEKIQAMAYTFGKYGLTGIQCLSANNAEQYLASQKIFNAVMAGIVSEEGRNQTLLEDMPEYFGERVSMYLAKKKPARFPFTAPQIVERATDPEGCSINGQVVRLSPEEAQVATALIAELIPSVNQTHVAALDVGSNGILAQTRKGLQNKQKLELDDCDQWLMAQFPSFPMDTQLEKSNAQLIRAIQETDGRNDGAPPEGFVSREEYEAVLEENSELRESQKTFAASVEERFAALEGKAAGSSQA
jgi:hypothetical protein